MQASPVGVNFMVDFKTWWKYREGKESTITVSVIVILLAVLYYEENREKVGPEICTSFCSSGKGGILRYPIESEKEECMRVPVSSAIGHQEKRG